mmetsp:Transcript_42221/g.83552  ORF Transcript_42221/g.83552 Transcript_42221/m.83552 type:complete len:636 (-) Transcript_42221:341-2248(-)
MQDSEIARVLENGIHDRSYVFIGATEEPSLRTQNDGRAVRAKGFIMAILCSLGALIYFAGRMHSLWNFQGSLHSPFDPTGSINEVLTYDQAPKDKFSLAGKSVYFLMVDRFARDHGGHDKGCQGEGWCGGTLKGLIRRLDYIEHMGFDCVWITPVIKQFEGTDPTNNCTGYHGYWAYKWFEIDAHFGSAQDLKALSEALHKRGMCLVYDMVVNHVGPLLSEAHVAKVAPFGKPEYFHQRAPSEPNSSKPRILGERQQPARASSTFNDYTKCMRNRNKWETCLTPLQANVGFGSHGDASCGVGMYNCKGYDEGVINDGWLYDLGDLNQSVPFVRKELLRWAVHMVKTYKIDAIRLDTAAYVPKDFLAELQQAVDVEIFGEVTTNNITFHSSFQQEANLGGKTGDVLAGAVNFPLYYTTKPAFCGPNLDLNGVGYVMKEQLKAGRYARPDLLGNFVDNHDLPPRIGYSCKGEKTRVMNALAFTMFARGVPIIYAGTEQGMAEKNDFRNSLWETGYRSDADLYNFMADMNRIRRDYNASTVDAEVVVSSQTHLVFTRRGKWGVWICLNNLNSTEYGLVYTGAKLPPAPDGQMWANVLWSLKPARAELDTATGDFVARDSFPKVLVLVPDDETETETAD